VSGPLQEIKQNLITRLVRAFITKLYTCTKSTNVLKVSLKGCEVFTATELAFMESSLLVCVMLMSKSVSILNRIHARRVDSGKNNDFLGVGVGLCLSLTLSFEECANSPLSSLGLYIYLYQAFWTDSVFLISVNWIFHHYLCFNVAIRDNCIVSLQLVDRF